MLDDCLLTGVATAGYAARCTTVSRLLLLGHLGRRGEVKGSNERRWDEMIAGRTEEGMGQRIIWRHQLRASFVAVDVDALDLSSYRVWRWARENRSYRCQCWVGIRGQVEICIYMTGSKCEDGIKAMAGRDMSLRAEMPLSPQILSKCLSHILFAFRRFIGYGILSQQSNTPFISKPCWRRFSDSLSMNDIPFWGQDHSTFGTDCPPCRRPSAVP